MHDEPVLFAIWMTALAAARVVRLPLQSQRWAELEDSEGKVRTCVSQDCQTSLLVVSRIRIQIDAAPLKQVLCLPNDYVLAPALTTVPGGGVSPTSSFSSCVVAGSIVTRPCPAGRSRRLRSE